ncbi:hypothetical protein HPB47_000434 [Ixodes persulcatus]|uniref:Uncharacterized protein n=1 Tax=Ixodes persulcatus TaxID=34615 RepID=A0AC60PRX5_IXOPE|nr:hypothetical protein HPB47_000434 [Ixodes persulcatus]
MPLGHSRDKANRMKATGANNDQDAGSATRRDVGTPRGATHKTSSWDEVNPDTKTPTWTPASTTPSDASIAPLVIDEDSLEVREVQNKESPPNSDMDSQDPQQSKDPRSNTSSPIQPGTIHMTTRQQCALRARTLKRKPKKPNPPRRVICMDMVLGGTRVRIININATADNKRLNAFFSNLEPFLLNCIHAIIGGDFNCVLDGLRDAHSPAATPRTSWCTRELELMLDRFYLPPSLMRLLKDCEVLDPSLTGLRVSDHHATVITINVRGGHNAWEQVKDQLRQRFTEWGKIKACKHTQTINSVAQKIRILTRAPIHTPLSLSDIELLRAQHQELLRTTSLVARGTSPGGPDLDELDSVVERARRDMAPGPDGLPHGFFRVFWSVLRQYFVRVVRHLFTTPERKSSFTSGLLILIPKPDSQPSDSSTWRPISLLNCDYKLVTSPFSNRLHLVQASAVHGRSMYTVLHRATQGGYNIFNVTITPRTLPLHTTLKILEDPDHPAATLAIYLMGPLACHLTGPNRINSIIKREVPG